MEYNGYHLPVGQIIKTPAQSPFAVWHFICLKVICAERKELFFMT